MRKYSGNTEPEAEALHIENNRLRLLIRNAKQRTLIKSGMADPGIQATKNRSTDTNTIGKYFGRTVMAFDPRAFENLERLSGILITNNRLKEMQKGVTMEDHLKRLGEDPAFQTASSRQSIWKKATAARTGIQVAENMYDRETLKKIYGDNIPTSPNAPMSLKKADELPTGKVMGSAELEALRADQDRVEQKLGLGNKKKSAKQIRGQASDMFDDLDKAAALEDARLKKLNNLR